MHKKNLQIYYWTTKWTGKCEAKEEAGEEEKEKKLVKTTSFLSVYKDFVVFVSNVVVVSQLVIYCRC